MLSRVVFLMLVGVAISGPSKQGKILIYRYIRFRKQLNSFETFDKKAIDLFHT